MMATPQQEYPSLVSILDCVGARIGHKKPPQQPGAVAVVFAPQIGLAYGQHSSI